MVRAKKRASQRARDSKRYRTAVRSLGLRIRQLRHEKDLTLEEAAERGDLAWKHLARIEAGEINASMVSLVRIAQGLDVSVEQLFVGVR